MLIVFLVNNSGSADSSNSTVYSHVTKLLEKRCKWYFEYGLVIYCRLLYCTYGLQSNCWCSRWII